MNAWFRYETVQHVLRILGSVTRQFNMSCEYLVLLQDSSTCVADAWFCYKTVQHVLRMLGSVTRQFNMCCGCLVLLQDSATCVADAWFCYKTVQHELRTLGSVSCNNVVSCQRPQKFSLGGGSKGIAV